MFDGLWWKNVNGTMVEKVASLPIPTTILVTLPLGPWSLCMYSCQHVLSDGKLDIWLTFVSPEPRKWVKRYVFHHLKTKNAIPVQKIMKSTTSRRLLAQVQTVVAACGGRGDCVLCTVFHHVLSTILITNKKRYRDSGASGKVTKTVV